MTAERSSWIGRRIGGRSAGSIRHSDWLPRERLFLRFEKLLVVLSAQTRSCRSRRAAPRRLTLQNVQLEPMDRAFRSDSRQRTGVCAVAAALVAGALFASAVGSARGTQPTFERLFPLASAEGVFAYARISPDGRTLAYASEVGDRTIRGGIQRTVTVVDLATRTVVFREPGIDAYWSTDG